MLVDDKLATQSTQSTVPCTGDKVDCTVDSVGKVY